MLDFGNGPIFVDFGGAHAPSDYRINSVVDDYPQFTLLLQVACFAEGTRLLTDAGERPVEALRPGDRVATVLGGGLARIRWVGQRRIDLARHPEPSRVRPVRIAPGALAAGVPHRALLLSPDHALHLGGALIPAHLLVNGATITQIDAESVTYWHVELDRHDVVLAEGAAVETYLDTGNRGAFAGQVPSILHPDFAAVSGSAWHERACAPLLLGGAGLAAIRDQLLHRAAALGWSRGGDAGLSVFAGETALPARWEGEVLVADLPPGCAQVRLRCRSFRPSWSGGEDHRRLGVAVIALALDGRAVAVPSGAPGWYAPEDGLCWTDGDAALDTQGSACLRVTRAAAGGVYWRRGAAGAEASGVAGQVDRSPRAGS